MIERLYVQGGAPPPGPRYPPPGGFGPGVPGGGAPGGYAPGAPGAPPPAPHFQSPQNPKKSGSTIWIAAGCASIVLMGAVAGGGVLLFQKMKRDKQQEAVDQLFEAAQKADPQQGTTSTDVAGACAQAAKCCNAIAKKSGGPNSHCTAYTSGAARPSSCASALDGLRRGAVALGISCD